MDFQEIMIRTMPLHLKALAKEHARILLHRRLSIRHPQAPGRLAIRIGYYWYDFSASE